MSGLGSRAKLLAQLLEASAIVIRLIHDLLKSAVTRLVQWLAELWIPAMLSGGPAIPAALEATKVEIQDQAEVFKQWLDIHFVLLTKTADVLQEIYLRLPPAPSLTGRPR